MHILFLSAWCPYPADNGAKLRIYHVLRGLAQHHDIDLVSFCPQTPMVEQAAHLQSVCREVELLHESPFAQRQSGRIIGLFSSKPRSVVANFSQRMAALVHHYLRTRTYDLVIASTIHMAPYAILAPRHTPIVLEELELGTLLDQVSSSSNAISRLRHKLMWWKMQRYISTLLRRYAGVSVVSEAERSLVADCAAHLPASRRPTLAIVPNGVDLTGYAGSFGTPDPNTLVYPGALSYDANFDAVAYFVQEIQPRITQERPATRLQVTGHATPDQIAALPHDPSIEFTGYLDDIRPTIARAWVEIVPLRKGGGTRLKVLEALALGTPVVSTTKGIEGLDLVPEYDVLVADTPEAFAAQTLRLLRSPDLRRDVVEHGRLAAARYDWRLSVERLEHLLEHAQARGC